jgi:flagellin-specific chaperone FliS
MRNREFINRKLEQLDHTLINLQRIVNTQEPIEAYKGSIGKAQDIVEELRTVIEREPMSPQESNSSLR